MPIFEQVKKMVEGTELEGCIRPLPDKSRVYLRFDIDDSDPKEQWFEYTEIKESLKRVGLRFIDEPDNVLVEHDCISGDIELIIEGDL